MLMKGEKKLCLEKHTPAVDMKEPSGETPTLFPIRRAPKNHEQTDRLDVKT